MDTEEDSPHVIYEDKDILVLNKPAGMLVHATLRGEHGTLVDWVLERYPELRGVGEKEAPYLKDPEDRSGVVHRLDKETSGVIVFAKNDTAHEFLKKQFERRHVKKTYYALVHGNVGQKKGVIRTLVGKVRSTPIKQRAVKRVKDGEILNPKEAVTRYTVLERFPEYTFLEINPETGRTHQIRIHMEYLGKPIVGDTKYGSKEKLPKERIFLHAGKLMLKLPNLKEAEFQASLSQDLQDFLVSLRIKTEPSADNSKP